MHCACLTELTRGMHGPAFPTLIQLQFSGTVPVKDLRLLCTLYFLETEQKPYRETCAKEISVDDQPDSCRTDSCTESGVTRLGQSGRSRQEWG